MVNWQPNASLATLQQRAAVLAEIRQFFAARNVLEVETPALSNAAIPDPNLHSFTVENAGYLHTSPEFPMKRLLAAGSGPIYQLARVFRAGEAGRFHNPEFTLLEWYRSGWDYQQLMREVAELINQILPQTRPVEWLTYHDAVLQYASLDEPMASSADIQACLHHHHIPAPKDLPRADYLDLLVSSLVQPKLGRNGITFLIDYPANQAALAKINNGLAQRFEVFIDGVELANGFQELTDAAEQRRRFERENAQRSQQNLPIMPLDEHFLAALHAGLPESAGVALGIERLLMCALGAESIQEVMAFANDRA